MYQTFYHISHLSQFTIIVVRVKNILPIIGYSYRKVKPPPNKEVLNALDVLRRAAHHRGNHFNAEYDYEQYISEIKFISILFFFFTYKIYLVMTHFGLVLKLVL